LPPDIVDLWGIRILACRRASARALVVAGLSATVVVGAPGVAGAKVGRWPVGWGAASVRFEPVDASGTTGLTVAGTGTYRGGLEIRRDGRALAVVNHVGFEDYVRGIDEVPFGWPAAALQAQAIAARTYAAHRAANAEDTPWRGVGADICSTSRCQVYSGLGAERKAGGAAWVAAVQATAGRILVSGGRPILASYSSTADVPLSMSQTGALEMANAGASAADILAAYYGVRPTSAPGRIPATIRVALETGATGTVRVTGERPFRVVDDHGTELAAAGSGEWKVAVDGDGVRVLPPDGKGAKTPSVAAAQPVADVVRRPARGIAAAALEAEHGPWAVTAGALVGGVAALATITLRRRRDA
jgi:hypothetical protein